ncbi:hypothetical protein ACHAPQ_011794 [Fusarium lateritium]
MPGESGDQNRPLPHLRGLPAEIKDQILNEVWSLDPFNGYKTLLNVALSCDNLSKHALQELYFIDAKESLKLDDNSDMPLALQWACWYGVLNTAEMSLAGLTRTGLDVTKKISTPFNSKYLYELRYQSTKRKGRPYDLAHGYVHWGSRSGLLHLACLRGNTAIAKLLIDAGVDPDTANQDLLPPLAHALNEDVAKVLIEEKADINNTRHTEVTPLCNLITLASMGDQDWAKEPNMPQGEGALKAPDTHHNFLSTIRYLIKDAKADISPQEVNRSSPLLKAVQTRYAEAVELLLEAGASPNPIDTSTGQMRLLLVDAMKRGENHRVVKMLLEAGAEVEPPQMPVGDLTKEEGDELPIMHLTNPNSNPWHARQEHDIAQRICKRIKNIDKVIDGHTAMWHYIRKGRQDIAILLMQEGASPELANVHVCLDTLGHVAALEALD